MAIANIKQFFIERVGHESLYDEERELFEVRYSDHGGTNPSVYIPMAGDVSEY